MRRPPIACQRAVQSLQYPAPQHIWVPDEVLTLAVNRFFRSTCSQQKRHGSNVPGPLEARRRAAKRRMTASAGFYPQDNFPALFSLGSLFGYRSQPETSWRYEPPSLPKNAPLLGSYSSSCMNDRSGALRSSDWATDGSSVHHNTPWSLAPQSTAPSGTYDKPIDLEAGSQNSSTSQATETISIDMNSLNTCMDTFRACLVAAGDHRFNSVLKEAFTRCLPSAPLLWKYYTAVLQHLHHTGRQPRIVLQCLLHKKGRLLRTTNPFEAIEDFSAFIDQLSLVRTASPTHRIFAVLAQLAAEAGLSTTDSHDLIILRLMQQTQRAASYAESNELISPTNLFHALASKLRNSADNKLVLRHFGSMSEVKNIIHHTVRSIAQGLDRSSGAERALSYMPRKQLLAVVPDITLRLAHKIRGQRDPAELLSSQCFDIWLRLLKQVDIKNDTDQVLLKAALKSLARGLRSFDSKAINPAQHFVKALLIYQDLDIQLPSTNRGPYRVQELFVDVLLQIQTQAEAYTALLDLGLPLVYEHGGLIMLLRCVRALEEQKLPLATKMDFDSILANELVALSSSTADLSESELQTRASALQACEKLISALGRMGHALPAKKEEVATLSGIRQFNNVLAYARASNALPIAYRDATADLPLMERVALAHQLAHHYSQDTTRTHRAAWRSVYNLYRYLKQHSLPIGPLFTKALVHVSITRPMTENRFVSARRLIWTCHLVARVEGDEVAARVENRFFAWRGDLIGRAKRAFVGVGGNKQSKAHVATVKRLGLR